MTTVGDIIVGASTGTPARLGIGSTGNALIVTGGTPVWGQYAYKNLYFASTDTISLTANAPISIVSGAVILDTTSTKGASTQYGLSKKENALGNPGTNGYILSSTTAGVRSWIANTGGSMVFPGAGIASSSGSAWNTSYSASGSGTSLLTNTGSQPTSMTFNYVQAPTYSLEAQGSSYSNGMRSWTGYDIYPVPSPISAVGAQTTGGSLTLLATYIYHITYLTAIGETGGSPDFSITLTGSNNAVTLSVPLSSDPRVTSRKIYRTLANGSNYNDYYIGTIANNTTVSYTDNLADATITGAPSTYYGPGSGTFRPNTTSYYLTVDQANSLMCDPNQTSLGYGAGANVTYGGRNAFFGYNAGNKTTIGTNNVAIGSNALPNSTTGIGNTAINYGALYTSTTANYNTGIGVDALFYNTTGGSNTAVGYFALKGTTATSMFYNTSLGAYAGFNTVGNGSVFLGYYAGYYQTAGNLFFVDNQDRTSLALDKTNALLYGVFNATPASQTLTTNSAFTATYGVNIPSGQQYTINGTSIFSSPTISSPVINGTITGTGITTSGASSSVVSTTSNGTIVSAHIQGNQTITTSNTGAGAGIGTNLSLTVTGTDIAGLITLNTGSTVSPTTGIVVIITFATTYGTTPYATITPASATAAPESINIYATTSTAQLALSDAGTPLAANTTYKWYYQVIQ